MGQCNEDQFFVTSPGGSNPSHNILLNSFLFELDITGLHYFDIMLCVSSNLPHVLHNCFSGSEYLDMDDLENLFLVIVLHHPYLIVRREILTMDPCGVGFALVLLNFPTNRQGWVTYIWTKRLQNIKID